MISHSFLTRCLAGLTALLLLTGCNKPEGGGYTPPPPEENGGNTNPGGNPDPDPPTPDPPVEDNTHCTDIGQTPVVLAYYTENSPKLPNVKLLTHINYAHGRFVDTENGTGGIWIRKSSPSRATIPS